MTAQPASTVDVLKAARELIAKPEAWTKGVFARDAYGTELHPDGTEAVCWCAAGAVMASGGKDCPEDPAIKALKRAVGAFHIADFNDAPTTTHPMILAVFDKAIALAEGEV